MTGVHGHFQLSRRLTKLLLRPLHRSFHLFRGDLRLWLWLRLRRLRLRCWFVLMNTVYMPLHLVLPRESLATARPGARRRHTPVLGHDVAVEATLLLVFQRPARGRPGAPGVGACKRTIGLASLVNLREVAPVLFIVQSELVFAGVAQSALLTRRLGGRPCLGRYWLGLGRRLLNRSFGPLARARRLGGRRAGGRLRPTAWSCGNVLLLILALWVVLPLLRQSR